jgi:hypothetical protein
VLTCDSHFLKISVCFVTVGNDSEKVYLSGIHYQLTNYLTN